MMLLHNSLAAGSSSKLLHFHDFNQALSDFCLLKPHSGKLASSNLTQLLGPEEQTTQVVFLRCTFETLLVLGLGNIFQVKPSHRMTKPQARSPFARGRSNSALPGIGSASETTSWVRKKTMKVWEVKKNLKKNFTSNYFFHMYICSLTKKKKKEEEIQTSLYESLDLNIYIFIKKRHWLYGQDIMRLRTGFYSHVIKTP